MGLTREDSTKVMHPAYLCNPTKKTHTDGRVSEVNNPTEHLVCYAVDNESAGSLGGGFVDQFQQNQFDLIARKFLCVPSEKEEVVQIEGGTGGKVKSIYR